MLKGKHILIGVTGSIAAYKTAMLIRLLVKEGAEVKVIMTKLAKEFITPLTLATLSKNPILVDFFNPENGEWNSHVSLGEWADAYIIAPATANTIGKMCHGIADNLLLTAYLSARCPVFVSPAMDLDMYAHITTTTNLATLRTHGVHVIEPGCGELASGLIGKGRMAEPEEIAAYVLDFFKKRVSLKGKKAVITTGGTVEKIDAVRYISNYSTGKMGYAIAKELQARGAEVIIIRASVDADLIGSVHIATEICAMSANEMYEAATRESTNADIIVMAAAVADYTPTTPSELKIKKLENCSIELTQTKDIAAAIGASKREGQILVGFALESHSEMEYAQGKLKRKNLDFIVLNSLADKGAGFGYNTNKVTIIDAQTTTDYPLKSKDAVAVDIVNEIERRV
ncbi:MAG: bifunctional phosphopantothenoylcysteine decarboxylase/phosphopantothenate--cysteine ligase CoaBC [Rikenellaceae bacterium]